MPLLTSLLFLLVASRLLGQLISRFGQPAVVGELLAGILLGPSLLGFIEPTPALSGIAELSVFLVVLSAGLEMELGDVVSAFRRKGLLVAATGFVIPFVLGLALGIVFGLDEKRVLFLALCISITALPVAIRILENFGLLNTNIARYAVATAILNDVAALLCLGVILDTPSSADGQASLTQVLLSVLGNAAKLALFAAIVVVASRLLRWGGKQTGYIEDSLKRVIALLGREALFGIAVVFVLAFASMSETLGAHFIIGAFFGALLLSKDVFGTSFFSELQHTLNSITSGFLAPVFFGYLGLHFSLSSLTHLPFVLSVLFVSVASKIWAGWLAGRWAGLQRHEALGIGIILNGRGIMELVVANIALQRGLIEQELFSTLVLMGVFTTIITPLLFRRYVVPSLGTASLTGTLR